MKKLLIALAGAACLLSSVSAAQADQLRILKNAASSALPYPDFPPFGSVGTDLQPQGYDIDMARHLAKSMKLAAAGPGDQRQPRAVSADR